ncbi:MAG: LysR family transcriptional regulator [Alphaproteobacteria bacterium]|nr:LysR family transcriptional regulator [Alphaproteobacteria bacterium]
MNWDDLKLFLAIGRLGKLTAASRRLGLDVATLNRRMTSLEHTLATKLFERSPKGYALSDVGHALMRHAEAMELAAEAAQEEVGQTSAALNGAVRIGVPEGVGNFLLSEVCVDLCNANPDLDMEVVALPRVFSLSQREADLAIAVSPPPSGRLTVQKITDYRLRLYAVDALIDRHDGFRRDWDLRQVRWVGYISDLVFDPSLDYIPHVVGDVRPALTSTSLLVQLRWLLAGAGVGILPDFIARAYPDLKPVRGDQISLKRSFYLIRHETDVRLKRVTAVADRVVAGIRDRVVAPA